MPNKINIDATLENADWPKRTRDVFDSGDLPEDAQRPPKLAKLKTAPKDAKESGDNE